LFQHLCLAEDHRHWITQTVSVLSWCCIQVGPELRLWQQLTAELVRQAHLDCSERGQLLQAATKRQQLLLQQALDMCDTLQQTLLSTATAQQQQQAAMLAAQAEAQALQQDNSRLKVRAVGVLPHTAMTCSAASATSDWPHIMLVESSPRSMQTKVTLSCHKWHSASGCVPHSSKACLSLYMA
jgi:hypothetical protein